MSDETAASDPARDIEAAFADGSAFVPYLAAGDPNYDDSLAYVEALDRGGADVIELGLPFSEPIAEGPTIQSAVVRALDAGMTPNRFFEFVEDLDVSAPLVCMTYYNLIYQYERSEGRRPSNASGETESEGQRLSKASGGTESGADPPAGAGGESATRGPRSFVERAAEVGIEGFVVPDLPAEEAGELRAACDEFGLDLIFIVAPTTRGERLERMMKRVSGYVYVQARLGTTGAREDVSDQTEATLARLGEWDIPKAVGFGIKTGEHAERIVSTGADGVIVGSALVDIVAEGHEAGRPATETAEKLEAKAAELAAGARRGANAVPEPEQP